MLKVEVRNDGLQLRITLGTIQINSRNENTRHHHLAGIQNLLKN